MEKGSNSGTRESKERQGESTVVFSGAGGGAHLWRLGTESKKQKQLQQLHLQLSFPSTKYRALLGWNALCMYCLPYE